MRKTILFIMGLFFFLPQSRAVNFYHFEKTTGTYVALSADTLVPNITTDTGQGYEYAFEFAGDTFSFFNRDFPINDTSVLVYFSTNGHMALRDDTTFLIFDGLFTYLDSIDNTSSVSYKIEGSGNNKLIKIQWKNLKLRAGPAGNYANVQIWMYQATGIVEVHYGASSANNQSGYNISTGPNVGMFYSNNTFTQMYEKIWINGLPSSYTIDSAHTVVFHAMLGVPPNGTVYRFVPNPPLSTATAQKDESTLLVYPNPANTAVTVQRQQQFQSTIELQFTDIQGKVLQQQTITGKSHRATFDTEHIPTGIYHIKATEHNSTAVYSIEVNH